MGRRKKSSTTHEMEVDQSEATSSGAEALYTDDDTLYLEEETVTNVKAVYKKTKNLRSSFLDL
jgi:hypothetical protein